MRSIWAWYRHPWRTFRGWPRWAQVVTALLLVALIGAVIASNPKQKLKNTSRKLAMTTTSVASADADAKALLGQALKLIASDYQAYHSYVLETPVTLGNVDHHLRGIQSLRASGTASRFAVSIRSSSGTTFALHGVKTKITRTCSPAGPGCPHGSWTGPAFKLPRVPVVSATAKAKVRRILTGSVDHYAQLFTQGKQALGTTQYASASAGLAAFKDKNSAASRFSRYRMTSKVERDVTYLTAFARANHFYTAANEPTAISTWRDDMGSLTTDLDHWVSTAVDWQIQQKSTAQLLAAESKVHHALLRARLDAARVVASK